MTPKTLTREEIEECRALIRAWLNDSSGVSPKLREQFIKYHEAALAGLDAGRVDWLQAYVDLSESVRDMLSTIPTIQACLDAPSPSPDAREERIVTECLHCGKTSAADSVHASWCPSIKPPSPSVEELLEEWRRVYGTPGKDAASSIEGLLIAGENLAVTLTRLQAERHRVPQDALLGDTARQLRASTRREAVLREALAKMVAQFRGQLRRDAWEFEIGFDAARDAIKKARAALADRGEG